MIEYMDIARVGVGFFFAASGWHKLVLPSRHKSLVETLEADAVPLVKFNQWFVPGVEFAAGAALAVGLLTHLAAVGLVVICLVACLVDAPKRVAAWAPVDLADRVDDWLYLPEVLYLFMLGYFVLNGGGSLSVDALLMRVLG